MSNITTLILIGVVMFGVLCGVSLLSHIYSLNGIKSKTVGDGQHGTARWATKREIKKHMSIFHLHQKYGENRLRKEKHQELKMEANYLRELWLAVQEEKIQLL